MEMKLREMSRPLAAHFPHSEFIEWSAQGTLEYLPGAGCLNTRKTSAKYRLYESS